MDHVLECPVCVGERMKSLPARQPAAATLFPVIINTDRVDGKEKWIEDDVA